MSRRLSRLKAIFTLVSVLSLVLFLAQNLYLEDTLTTHNYVTNTSSSSLFKDLFEYIQVRNQASHFILIAVRQSPSLSKPTPSRTVTASLTRHDISAVFALLASADAFILDVEALETLQTPNTSVRFKKLQTAYDSMSNASHTTKQDFVLINFGVAMATFDRLYKAVNSHLDSHVCSFFIRSNSTMFSGEAILTSLFIQCHFLTIQVSVVYERGNFLWTLSDEYTRHRHRDSLFGRVPRALGRFGITRIVDADLNKFNVPSNIKKYLFDYEHSEFIECNKQLQAVNSDSNYVQNDAMNRRVWPAMDYIARSLEGMSRHYWLGGGTLLGWYRDCGIIPHTKDVDFGMLAEEYGPEVRDMFLGNEQTRLWGALGLVNDSYELRLTNDHFTFDIFLVYNLNETHRWCGYQVYRKKYRRFLPNFKTFCSAELFDSKYMIPCDPVGYLDNEYGPMTWQKPVAKKYYWNNLAFSEYWSSSEWPKAVRFYDRNGKLLHRKIANYVKKYGEPPLNQF